VLPAIIVEILASIEVTIPKTPKLLVRRRVYSPSPERKAIPVTNEEGREELPPLIVCLTTVPFAISIDERYKTI
jgi:hypothetical protein